jgi:hypothetical protein
MQFDRQTIDDSIPRSSTFGARNVAGARFGGIPQPLGCAISLLQCGVTGNSDAGIENFKLNRRWAGWAADRERRMPRKKIIFWMVYFPVKNRFGQ